MDIQIRTANNKILSIPVEDKDLLSHFSDQNNCTDIILKQINEEDIYGKIFEGEEDLTVVDIGANIGLFSVYATGFCKKIIAVEPTPSHFSKLVTFTKPFEDTITTINAAIGPSTGTLDFYTSRENPTQNSLISNWRSSDEIKISVESMTINSLLDKNNIDHVDLIKMDIEGGELLALTEQTVGEVNGRVDCWYVEVHQTDNTIPHGESVAKNLNTLTNIFTKCGYQVQKVGFDNLWCWKE